MGYDELDKILMGIEKNEISDIEKEKLEHVKRMVKNSEHKRRLPDIFRP